MGIRKLIYIPSQGMWDSVVDQARSEGRSVSAYLLNIHCEHLNCLGNSKWENDGTEHKNIGNSVDSVLDESGYVGYRPEINAPSKSVKRRLTVQKKDLPIAVIKKAVADFKKKGEFFNPDPKKGKKK